MCNLPASSDHAAGLQCDSALVSQRRPDYSETMNPDTIICCINDHFPLVNQMLTMLNR
jgi:hypothetical protein